MTQYITDFYSVEGCSERMPAVQQTKEATGTSEAKGKQKKKKSRFVEEEAEVSGSDCCSGDEEDLDEDDSNSLKDFVASSDEEEGYEKLPRLSKKDRRLARGDRLLVKEAARRRGRRRVLRDDSEDEHSEADQDGAEHSDGSFVVEDGEDSDAVCEEIHKAMRESGLVRKGSRADARGEGVLRITENVPFGLRDERTGAVVNGRTGEALKPASSGTTFAAPCVRPKPHSLAPKPPVAAKRTNRQAERDRVFRETTEFLMNNTEFSDEEFDAVPAFSAPSALQPAAKKQKSERLPVMCTPSASQSFSKKQKNAHLPDAAQKSVKAAVFAMGVSAKKAQDKDTAWQRTGVFMCKETGKCYKKNKDGTREELDTPA